MSDEALNRRSYGAEPASHSVAWRRLGGSSVWDTAARWPGLWVFVATLSAAIAAIAVLGGGPGGDGTSYLAMAQHPGLNAGAPYVTRVLGPLLVWIIPTDAATGFRALAAVSFALAAMLLYWFLDGLTGSRQRAVGGVLVFLAGTSVGNIEDPFLLDAISYCFVIGILLAAARERWWWLVILAPLALLTRDAIVALVLPGVAVFAAGRRRARVPLAVAAATVAVVWILLNKTSLILGYVPPELNNFSRGNIKHVLDYERALGGVPKVAISSVLFVFGAVWLVPALDATAIRRHRWAIAACASGIAAILLAPFVTDWTRALAYAFPLVCVGVALHPREPVLGAAISLAFLVAVADYGIAAMPGGGPKYLLEAVAVTVELCVLAWMTPKLIRWTGPKLGGRTKEKSAQPG